MSSDAHNSDSLLRQLGGCGRFQILLTVCASLTYVSVSFTSIFMTFGSYNPGWRCLDNVTSSPTNVSYESSPMGNVSERWTEPNATSPGNGFSDSCTGFVDCRRVEFNPESSTIVTEWGLICDQTWKASLIISLQMVGLAIGAILGGFLGDAIGRKRTLYINVFIHAALIFVSVASSSWEMFAVLLFVLGVSAGIVFSSSGVYMAEFVTPKWRAVIPSLPLWCIGCVMFSVCAAVLKNWRHLHIFNGVFSLLIILPALKCPESLRWLAVNNKEKKTLKAVSQIAEMNRVDKTNLGSLSYLSPANHLENRATKTKAKADKILNFTRLFRKGYRFVTFALCFAIFTSNLIYFSTNFGLGTLPGNIYVNNIIVFATELPANLIASLLPNMIGRKPTGIAMQLLETLSILIFLASDFFLTGSAQSICVLVSVIAMRLCNGVTYYLVVTLALELYPTVIRTVAVGWVIFVGSVGGMISPYLVLSSDIIMRISYLVMAAFSLIGCGLFVFVPETLGKDLEDDFSDDDGGGGGCLENDDDDKIGTYPSLDCNSTTGYVA